MGKPTPKNESHRKTNGNELPARSKNSDRHNSNTQRRSTIRDILLGLVVCAVFFGVLETVLRVTGVPSQRMNDDPYVGFSGLQPLFSVKDGTATTADNKLKYFNKISFPVEKRADTIRVFCFGGSTTYGHPFDGRTAFPRWLGELLAASMPGKNFEVLNAGGISYASYRIKPLVQEALGYNPDLMVILTGENEFLERRTYSGLFDQGRTLLTMRSIMERLHIYRGLELMLQPIVAEFSRTTNTRTADGTNAATSNPSPRSDNEHPQKTVLKDEITTILDQSAGLELYHRDEEFSRGVIRHFTRNMKDMITMCRDARVPVVLVEPVANLKDFSPFKTEHSAGLDESTAAKVDQDLDAAERLIGEGEFKEALNLLTACIKADPSYAVAHYLTGKALLGLRRPKDALESFVRAKDLDVCPLRAPSSILKQLRFEAKETGVTLIPFQELLTAMQVPNDDGSGIAGDERMLDHVHPVIAGHQLLAEEIFHEMVRLEIVKPAKRLSRGDKDAIYSRILSEFDKRFFALRDWNLAKTLCWAGKRTEARAAVLRSLQFVDSQPEAHAMLGSFLLDEQNYERAVDEFEKAVALSENRPDMLYGLAVAYYASGRKQKAERSLRLLVDADQALPDAYCKLALIYLGSRRPEEALQVLSSGLRKNPDFPPLLSGQGLALCASGKPLEGIPWMLKALEKEPGNPDYQHDLAMMYSLSGQKDKALETLQTALERGYENVRTVAEDPVFEAIKKDERFRSLLTRFGYNQALSKN